MKRDDRHPDPARAAKSDLVLQRLLADADVAECVVLERGDALVALVVPAKRLTRALWERLRGLSEPDAALIPVSALPLTGDGALDLDATSSFEAIDDEAAKRWEEQLRRQPGFESATVIVESKRRAAMRLHLSDLLPKRARQDVRGNDVHTDTPGQSSTGGRAAIAHGEALRPLDDAPQTLGDALVLASKEAPARGILYLDDDATSEIRTTYADLLDEASRVASGLHAAGVERGERVIVLLERNRDFVPAFWGCVLAGAVPLPASVSTDSHAAQAAGFWRALGGPRVLASRSSAQLWKGDTLSLDDLRKHERRDLPACNPDDLALMLATSGSTGTPKFVTHTHRTVLHLCAATAQKNAFTRDEISLNWFPLDHVGGLVMFHIRDVFLRCQEILGRIDVVLRDPLTWLEWIERYHATVTWAPNFAYALVTSRLSELASRRFDLSSMRFVLNGGEAIVARQARRFLSLLGPHGLRADAMHPAWGMSETCSGISYSDRFSLDATSDDDAHVEVGEPIPGISMRIVGPDGAILQEGEVGALEVQGPSITLGYHDNPEANADAFTTDGWFRTGDLAILQEGRLTITGREKDVIIVNGVNFSSHAIESVVESVPGVAPSFAAAIGVREAGDTTDQLAIVLSPSDENEPRDSLVARIRERVAHEAGIVPAHVVPVAASEIPKTAIGKIQRSQLRRRFEEGAYADILKELDLAAGNSNTIPDWFYRRSEHGLEKADLLAEPPGENPFVAGGTYVMAGVENPFASDLARHLLQKEGVRLLVLDSSGDASRLRWLRAFEDAGSAIRLENGGVERAISEAERRWGRPIDGIIDLTGEVDVAASRLLLRITPATLDRSNAPPPHAHTIAWHLQSDFMAEGFHALSTQQALSSLLAVASRRPSSWVIGLDPTSPAAARHLHREATGLLQLTAYVPSESASAQPPVDHESREIRFDAKAVASWAGQEESPTSAQETEHEASGSRIRVRAIVADVLKLSPEAIVDSEPLQTITPLDSLSLIEIVSALEEQFDIRIKGDEITENVTLEDLTRLVDAASR